MLGYDVWGSNPSPVMLSGDDLTQDSAHPHSIIVDHYAAAAAGHHSTFGSHLLPGAGGGAAAFSPFFSQQQTPNSFQPLYDSRSYGAPSYSATPAATFSLGSFHGGADSFLVPVPKTEDVVARPPAVDWLNLGGRTNFSSAEDDIISRLYRRSRPLEPSGGAAKVPRCQAEECNADLTHAKHYHRRHKVCEFHSKAAAVMAAGLTQRFCQQCSRFHLLSEFDNGKRSCRKRLADHNRRRRKSQLPNNPETQKSHAGRSPTINGLAKSSQESAAQSSSSVTVAAASPPRMSLDCFRQSRPYHQAASASSSSVSSCSLFFSTG